MVVTQEAFEQVLLSDPERKWELHQGKIREKPLMTFGHNQVSDLLTAQLHRQVDLRRFVVRSNKGHVRRPDVSYYIPDIFVVPLDRRIPPSVGEDSLEVYTDPVLLVVEVWSPSTGGYDIDTKLPEYHARGDLEIWRLHPYERTLTAWRRQPDGSYEESHQQGGTIEPVALPGVTIDLDELFL